MEARCGAWRDDGGVDGKGERRGGGLVKLEWGRAAEGKRECEKIMSKKM